MAIVTTKWKGDKIVRWVVDWRARRVPKFVQELTGLDTKKKVLMKYGPQTVFEMRIDGTVEVYHAKNAAVAYDVRHGRIDRLKKTPPLRKKGKTSKGN